MNLPLLDFQTLYKWSDIVWRTGARVVDVVVDVTTETGAGEGAQGVGAHLVTGSRGRRTLI